MSLKQLSKSITPLTKPVFQRKFVKLGRIFELWPQIIGEDYKHIALPVALKSRKKDKDITFVLHIMSESAYAQRLNFQKDVILSRLEHYFGERIITDLIIRHGTLPAAKPLQKTASLSAERVMQIRALTEKINDETLRERLEQFAQSLYQSQK